MLFNGLHKPCTWPGVRAATRNTGLELVVEAELLVFAVLAILERIRRLATLSPRAPVPRTAGADYGFVTAHFCESCMRAPRDCTDRAGRAPPRSPNGVPLLIAPT